MVRVLSEHLRLVEEEEEEEEEMSLDSQVVLAKIAWEKERLERQEREREKERQEREKERQEREKERQEREKERQEREKERNFELEKMRLEQELNRSGPSGSEFGFRYGGGKVQEFDMAREIKLVPRFQEQDVDTYFLSFKKIAKRLAWPERYWTLLLHSVFTGKASEVCSTLDEEQYSDYEFVKAAVQSAYELVPEGYRQRFRHLQRTGGQTFVEFAREKELVFDKWYRSLQAEKDFCSLQEVVLLEEFKDSIPLDIKTHLDEHKVKNIRNAAAVADDYELTHKKSVKSYSPRWNNRRSRGANGALDGEASGESTKSQSVTPKSAENKRVWEKPLCYYCKKPGHVRAECFKLKNERQWRKPVAFARVRDPVRKVVGSSAMPGKRCGILDVPEEYKNFVSKGEVSLGKVSDSKPVVILRDTGAAQSLMLAGVLSLDNVNTDASVLVQGIGGGYESVPLYNVELRSDLVTGDVTVGVVKSLPIEGVTFLLGNDLAGGKVSVLPVVSCKPVVNDKTEELLELYPGIFPACVVTRSQTSKERQDELVSEVVKEDSGVWLAETFFGDLKDGSEIKTDFSHSSLVEQQEADCTLKELMASALSENEAENLPKCCYMKDGVLMRKWRPPSSPADEDWTVVHQIVVPHSYRHEILRIAHSIPVAGHLGIRKTDARIMAHFYWPKLHRDVVDYCKTCHTCQVVGKPQPAIKPAPLVPIPAFGEPFSKVLVDCVGPLPRTKTGFRFMLTIMDMATRYPEVVPLKTITAKVVVEALVHFFRRYGLPKEIQSDQGSNFMSGLFQEVMHQLGVSQLKSSAYHPQSQGALERYHQTLKNMLRSYCTECPEDWDKGIPLVLFATRDTPSDSTGFSPFELVYGHNVRGPLKLLREQFLVAEPETNMLDYICKFRERLFKAGETAAEHLKVSQNVMKKKFDRNAKARQFSPGEKVLVLLPLVSEPLAAKFSGPYEIKKKLSEVNYLISTPDRRKHQRVCHVNMIKKYFDCKGEPPKMTGVVGSGNQTFECEDENEDDPDPGEFDMSQLDPQTAVLSNSETLSNLSSLLSYLPEPQRESFCELIFEFQHLCSDELGRTTLAWHDVDVGEAIPIKQAPYRLNPDKLAKVNALTVTDSYPLPRIEDCIDKVGKAKYISKVDLLKGYWQVPLTNKAKEISAFVTPDGLFHCKVLPFGMKNAPATFQRLMDRVIQGVPNCVVYIDDVVIYSENWESHLLHLRKLFEKLTWANLVVNLTKSEFAKAKVTYLGHVIGQGKVLPRLAKVKAIVNFPAPKSKREILRFLGMSGFYRKFVANYSEVVAPLTNLLSTKVKFIWADECEQAFAKIKAVLIRAHFGCSKFQQVF
ncbi:uncharacterized protein LOC100372062 [Saccoglossus kowalevskii]|uniref:Uncharacterized protein LOC100372062 n=1 Tax=Saccoglossus kowalevskii TaxID=10224 RepID=A0ABM0M1E8_SACKO|nr:PREDICTED: uncharacterized protein LOC100372062 [Saccoglossus kowalevskii]